MRNSGVRKKKISEFLSNRFSRFAHDRDRSEQVTLRRLGSRYWNNSADTRDIELQQISLLQ
jgi:hypothetical protein